uniref:Uncharacterized protein n=1 Tax=Haptolina brevifila TaxID=156173 RepID=A0A7S2H174_9EUKA|mmetsp:Transcript_50020/g.99643  ORF Transcript_50020/g.99643 Transcript_50020/m.99643 type:complete len:170 (+) Transcript_50020:30-539(+)|eukprot:CAMPEP_0174725560 /NCGR_PEP_ID=MMETSP1094-20130205/45914_1 /TAXON_ID=156173 /ORGANISM="Chrysochromulina brevifilum, Strain UTEX LB 985" /LENGTH=169 /DNA_ID=CAMNT_0015926991 /DNA_START=27 /DNA_END=536 /DNA_ORIENTATION=+
MLRHTLLLCLLGACSALLVSRATPRSPAVRMQFSFSSLFGGGKKEPVAAVSKTLPVPKDVFDEELSAWPAILEIKDGLEAMSPEDQRRMKLEVGTNWPPRTSTTAPFDVNREGYMFFQGPTPKTSVQAGLPSFFSEENFEDMEISTKLKGLAGVGGLSFLVVGGTLLLA